MNEAERALVTRFAWALAAGALIAATSLSLLRRTRGVPAGQRIPVMARLAAEALWARLPPRWLVASFVAGISTFAGIFLTGMVITVIIVRLIPLEVPHPTEAYEGIGDFLKKMFYTGIGATLSFVMAVWTGPLIGFWVAWRLRSVSIGKDKEPMAPPAS